MYNDKLKCQKCGKDLTDNEICRIGRDKTLRLCNNCWLTAKENIKKISILWSKIGQL
jgi:uncharacterized Zn finger protein